MVNRQRIALAVLSALTLLPITAHAGAGGNPSAPGAGKSNDYCCQRWEGVREGPITFFTGTGCVAIAGDDAEARNACVHTVVKCRGEFYTPNPAPSGNGETPTTFPGRVDRCLTP
jgi:hypothetical protein